MTTAAALIVLLSLSGCAGGTAPDRSAPGHDVAPLGCDELVPAEDLVAAALTGADGVQPTPTPAMPPLEFDPFPMLLPAVGGLRCSWNAGTPAVDWASDWAYLSVEVLPDAGDELVVRTIEGDPIESTTSIGGYDAIATCADGAFECLVAASVDGVWMQVRLQWTTFRTKSPFAALDADVVLDRLAAVAEPAFAAVAVAEPAQLRPPAVAGQADCEGVGTPVAIPDAMPAFSAVIAGRAGVAMCDLAPGSAFIVPGAGAMVDAMVHEPDFDGALESFEDRVGYPALGRVWAPGGLLVVLTIGEDAYFIGAGDAVAVARDIVEARAADDESPQRPASPEVADIDSAEAAAVALVEATAAELGLTITTTYPPERRSCDLSGGSTGVVSAVAMTAAPSSTPDAELFDIVDRFWTSRGLDVYRPDNGIAATGADSEIPFETIHLSPSEFGMGPSLRVQLSCASE